MGGQHQEGRYNKEDNKGEEDKGSREEDDVVEED